MTDNIAKADGYKYPHYLLYRNGTEYVSSYIEARGCDRGWNEMVVAGTNYILDTYMSQRLVTKESLAKQKKRAARYGVQFNEEGFQYLLDKHDGYAPVEIQALPEGLVVPLGTPLVQVRNTDPKAYWATSFIETVWMRMWYPTTVATLSFHIKRIIKKYMLETAGHIEGLDFKLHDFGARGVSSSESAAIGGLAHLYNFLGTDTMEAVELAEELFGEETGFSVDAAEHSTITSFGGPEYELEAVRHCIETMSGPGKIFSIVSDTYNIFHLIREILGVELYDEVVALGKIGSKLVVRPDSGNPVMMASDVIEALMAVFGYTVNQKGFKVLPPYLGVIYGDGINEKSIEAILIEMKHRGLSAENIVFGMGGALLQGVNRDTLKFAMKASAVKNGLGFMNNEWYDIYKDPITDKGKRSKRGRQAVIRLPDDRIVPVREDELKPWQDNLFKTIYDMDVGGNGVILYDTLAKIRERINSAL